MISNCTTSLCGLYTTDVSFTHFCLCKKKGLDNKIKKERSCNEFIFIIYIKKERDEKKEITDVKMKKRR